MVTDKIRVGDIYESNNLISHIIKVIKTLIILLQ